jgi:hypothetical protein
MDHASQIRRSAFTLDLYQAAEKHQLTDAEFVAALAREVYALTAKAAQAALSQPTREAN